MMARQTHPDSHELDDWPLYGPKNTEVEVLVRQLALDHGLRVREIENVLVAALRQRLVEEVQRRAD